MQMVLTVSQMLVRVTGVLLLVLGLLIWTEGMGNLVFPHTLLGVLLVISLWVLAAVGVKLGAPIGLGAGVAILALLLIVLGMTQRNLLPGGSHWIIQIVHLLLGLAALGSAESLAGRLHRVRLASA